MEYEYTYCPQARILILDDVGIIFDLTEKEHNFLMLLMEKKFISKEEITRTLMGIYNEKSFNSVKAIKSRLCLKTFITIKTKNNCGYRLINKIKLKEV